MYTQTAIEPAHSLVSPECEQIPAGHNHTMPWTVSKLSLVRVQKKHLLVAAKQHIISKQLQPDPSPPLYREPYQDPRYSNNIIYQSYHPTTMEQLIKFNEFKMLHHPVVPNNPNLNIQSQQ